MTNSPDPKDVSMIDVSKIDLNPPQRRKSTLILTDEMDKMTESGDRMQVDQSQEQEHQQEQQEQQQQQQEQQQEQQQQQDQPQEQSQSQSQSHSQPQQEQEQPQQQEPQAQIDPSITIPVDIKWVQGGEKVYVTGSFTGWRKMIGLSKQPDGNFAITLGLPVGTHRFRFVIDNELRFSDFLPTATDQMGNFVNYVEVTPESIQSHMEQLGQKEQEENQRIQEQQQQQQERAQEQPQPQLPSRKSSLSRSTTRTNSIWGLTNDDDDMGNGYSRYHEEVEDGNSSLQYIADIPPIFTDPKVMEQYYMAIDKQSKSQNGLQQAWLHPPQLPPHLENVILNNFNSMDNNSGALPIPNHVVLNHLATTSIKHNTLAVASVVRYKRKYVTQVLYAPLQQ